MRMMAKFSDQFGRSSYVDPDDVSSVVDTAGCLGISKITLKNGTLIVVPFTAPDVIKLMASI